jgi:hypothetical protein
MSAGNGMASLPAHPPFLPGGFFSSDALTLLLCSKQLRGCKLT